jgi:DNA topoisomerase-3
MVSVGRVQTPTLALLVERELEIKNFKPENYYLIEGIFQTDKGENYKGTWGPKDKRQFKNKKDANALLEKLSDKNATVTKYTENRSEEKPPLLYDLTSLQMDANGRYGFSAQKTLEIMQKLYENQILTYPRTNSRYLGEDIKGEIPRILKASPDKYKVHIDKLLDEGLVYTKRYFNDKKVESHHAIIPTYKKPGSLSEDERKIYEMVVESLIKSFMAPAVWSNTKIETSLNGEVFYTSGKTLVEKGFRILDNSKRKDDILPVLSLKEEVLADKVDILTKKTKAPARYSEKTILSAMETAGKLVEDEELREAIKEHGIGTPATRAGILEKLIRVGYVKRDKKNLLPTEKGIEIIEKLPIEEVKSPTLTGEWEYKLGLIEKGELEDERFLKEITDYVVDITNKLKTYKKQEVSSSSSGALGKCPNCGSSVVQNKKGFGCSSWRDGCKFQIWSPLLGKKLTQANAKQLLTKGQTNLIKGFQSKRTGKSFNARLELVKGGGGKVDFKFDNNRK